MKIFILTLFPEFFKSPLQTSILGRAIADQKITIETINIRDYTLDKHKNVDDVPFGWGHGMLMTCQPLFDCIEDIKWKAKANSPVVFLSPHGDLWNQELAEQYTTELESHNQDIILLCGHYEGIDQRVIENLVDRQICIGHYILTGWEPAALCMIDSIVRLIKDSIGDEQSHIHDSFSPGLDRQLEYPQYTRPSDFRGYTVPEVLLSGHHAKIEAWKQENLIDPKNK